MEGVHAPSDEHGELEHRSTPGTGHLLRRRRMRIAPPHRGLPEAGRHSEAPSTARRSRRGRSGGRGAAGAPPERLGPGIEGGRGTRMPKRRTVTVSVAWPMRRRNRASRSWWWRDRSRRGFRSSLQTPPCSTAGTGSCLARYRKVHLPRGGGVLGDEPLTSPGEGSAPRRRGTVPFPSGCRSCSDIKPASGLPAPRRPGARTWSFAPRATPPGDVRSVEG